MAYNSQAYNGYQQEIDKQKMNVNQISFSQQQFQNAKNQGSSYNNKSGSGQIMIQEQNTYEQSHQNIGVSRGPTSNTSNINTSVTDLIQNRHPPNQLSMNNIHPAVQSRTRSRDMSESRQAAIKEEMMRKGFRPATGDNQFEYDSDSIEKYHMISNEFDYEELKCSDTFGIKQYKDSIYRGELDSKTRKRSGFGVVVYKNGRVYEGQWLQDYREGSGYEIFTSGNTYHGQYTRGKAHGKGVYSWANGEVYDGEWVSGVKKGYGVWRGTHGESYIGQWHDSKAEGYGVHVWGNGDKYEGEWQGCLRHGNGSDFFSNGDVYVGQYFNGKPEGFGQYKWNNGSSYTGQFKNGLKHGKGKWKKRPVDGRSNQYEGEYKDDKKHGHGVFEWESGNIYIGNYTNDERNNYGVMRWTDGSTYMGTWRRGIQHGVGLMIFPDGSRRAGFFAENVFKATLRRHEQLEEYRDDLDEDCYKQLMEFINNRDGASSIVGSRKGSEMGMPGVDSEFRFKAKRFNAEFEDTNQEMQSLQQHKMVHGHDNSSQLDSMSVISKFERSSNLTGIGQVIQASRHINSEKEGPSALTRPTEMQKMHGSIQQESRQSNKQGNEIAVQTDLHMQALDGFHQGNPGVLQANNSFADQLPNAKFMDTMINENIMSGGPPNVDSDSEFNPRRSSKLGREFNIKQNQSNFNTMAGFSHGNASILSNKMGSAGENLGYRGVDNMHSNQAWQQRNRQVDTERKHGQVNKSINSLVGSRQSDMNRLPSLNQQYSSYSQAQHDHSNRRTMQAQDYGRSRKTDLAKDATADNDSQQTLRYNDFEIVQRKGDQNPHWDEAYPISLDESGQKGRQRQVNNYDDSPDGQNRPMPSDNFLKLGLRASDIRQASGYRHRSRQLEPLSQIKETPNRHVNGPQYHTMDRTDMPYVMTEPQAIRIRKVHPHTNKSQSPPAVSRGMIRRNPSKNSRAQFRGPYAQNLSKPKIYEPRVASQNMGQKWVQPRRQSRAAGYHSDAAKQYIRGAPPSSGSSGMGLQDQVRHERFNSNGQNSKQRPANHSNDQAQIYLQRAGNQGNITIETSIAAGTQRKRVWVPATTVRSLKNMKIGMSKKIYAQGHHNY